MDNTEKIAKKVIKYIDKEYEYVGDDELTFEDVLDWLCCIDEDELVALTIEELGDWYVADH